MALAARRWDFTASASTSASAATATKVEPPFGYAQRGTGGQVVESAAAGKASIEELNKEKAMKQRVSWVCVGAPNLSLPTSRRFSPHTRCGFYHPLASHPHPI